MGDELNFQLYQTIGVNQPLSLRDLDHAAAGACHCRPEKKTNGSRGWEK